MYTYIPFLRFPSHLGYHRAQNKDPVLYSRFSLSIRYRYILLVSMLILYNCVSISIQLFGVLNK